MSESVLFTKWAVPLATCKSSDVAYYYYYYYYF